jgi:hypothetical protein
MTEIIGPGEKGALRAATEPNGGGMSRRKFLARTGLGSAAALISVFLPPLRLSSFSVGPKSASAGGCTGGCGAAGCYMYGLWTCGSHVACGTPCPKPNADKWRWEYTWIPSQGQDGCQCVAQCSPFLRIVCNGCSSPC